MRALAKKILITLICLAVTATLAFAHKQYERQIKAASLSEQPALDQLGAFYSPLFN